MVIFSISPLLISGTYSYTVFCFSNKITLIVRPSHHIKTPLSTHSKTSIFQIRITFESFVSFWVMNQYQYCCWSCCTGVSVTGAYIHHGPIYCPVPCVLPSQYKTPVLHICTLLASISCLVITKHWHETFLELVNIRVGHFSWLHQVVVVVEKMSFKLMMNMKSEPN